MPNVAPVVHETTTEIGLTSAGMTVTAVTGRQTFNSAFGTGGTDKFDYVATNRDASEWEEGTAHLSDATTFVSDTVTSSSNNNSAVTFTAGTKDITNDIPASKQVGEDLTQTLTNKTLGATTVTGILSQDNTTDSTSFVTGSIHTDGGLGVAKTVYCADLGIGVDPVKLLHIDSATAFQQYISSTNPSTVWGNNPVFASKTASTTIGVSTGVSQFLTGDASGDSIVASDNDLLLGTGMDPETATGTIRGMFEASTGHFGIGTLGAAPAAQLSVDQASTTAAVPVITMDQADVSEDFFKFISTSTDGSAAVALVNAGDFTTMGATAGYLKVIVQDDQSTGGITDGNFYLALYQVPTA